MTPKQKRELVEKLSLAFEEVVTKSERRKYVSYMRSITQAVVNELPSTKRDVAAIVRRFTITPSTAVKMFTLLAGVSNLIMGRPSTARQRQLLKPIQDIMKVYKVSSPQSFAKSMLSLTTGRKMSERQKRFRPLLLSYYDGFTENIETLEQQEQRFRQRTEIERVSQVFEDLEKLREARIPITQIKNELINKYNDPKRVQRALDTELHEQAERVKLEQSKFMGYKKKRWNTQGDERVRRTRFHNGVAGKAVPIDGEWRVGRMRADYAGDTQLPVGERIYCRCYVTYEN